MSPSHYYTALCALLGGVLVATGIKIPLTSLIFGMMLAVLCLLFWRRHKVALWLYLGLVLAFGVIGATRFVMVADTFGQSPLQGKVGETVTITGQVVREPDIRETSQHLYVAVDEDKLLITVDRFTEVLYGDVISVTGTLRAPEPFITDLGRTFNYPEYLKVRGVEYQINFADIEVLEGGKGNSFLSFLFDTKVAFKTKLNLYIAEPAAALGQGLLLGVKQALGEELETAFRKTGIIHIVVLSGYNIMLVVSFVMVLLRPVSQREIKLIIGVLAICSFALLVGLSATVLRACFMAIVLLMALTFKRLYLGLRILLLAAAVMVFMNPLLLVYDVGFQLSFLATLGLLLLTPQLERLFRVLPAAYGVRSLLAATLGAQIAVLPLLLYQVGEFSVVSLIVNLLVLPVVPLAMLLTFATGSLAFVSPVLASLLAWPTYLVLQYINEVALWFAALPFAAYTVPLFPFWLVVVIYAGLGVLLCRLYLKFPVPLRLPELGAERVLGTTKKSKVLPQPKLQPNEATIPTGEKPEAEIPIFFR